MNIELRVEQLQSCSYNELLTIIKQLEEVKPLNLGGIQAIEALDDYLLYLSIITKRIENDEFPELKTKANKEHKHVLLEQLARLRSTFTLSYDLNTFLWEERDEIDLYIKNEKKELTKELTDVKDEIKQFEHKNLSHNMSIMGIFSAIITIIMSVVVTSSSWLNGADGITSLIAFVVPALVVLLSVFVLVSLVYCYNNFFVFKQKRNGATIIFFSIVVTIIVALAVLIGVIFVNQSKQKPHTRHIISKTEYYIVSDQEEETIKYFEFNLDECNYRFVYDKSLLHENGYLYYCKEHRCLE